MLRPLWGDLALAPEVSVPALIKALHRGDERVRWSAAAALGRFGPEAMSAVPALRRALKDRDELVRRCAREALERITPRRARKRRPRVEPLATRANSRCKKEVTGSDELSNVMRTIRRKGVQLAAQRLWL
jgi:HEAT repeat protein